MPSQALAVLIGRYDLANPNHRKLRDEIAALEKQIKEKKPIEDRSAEIIFNDGMDDEEQESKSEKQVTNKMIEKWAKDVNQRNFSYSFYEGLIKGAKWMRDKLKTK